MRVNEHPCAETLQELAGGRELQNLRGGPVKDPDVAARVNVSRYDSAKLHARGKLRPTLSQPVWIVLRVYGVGNDDDRRNEDYNAREFRLKWI